MQSTIDDDTVQAYRQTHYRVEGRPSFILRIGVASTELVRLYKTFHSESAAFITACNPRSQRLDAATNTSRHDRLTQDLSAAGRVFLPGVGEHPDIDWPGESSYLVFGLSRDEAIALGRRYEQNAVVWCGEDTVPELVLLR